MLNYTYPRFEPTTMRHLFCFMSRPFFMLVALLTLNGCTGVQVLNTLAPTEAIAPTITREYDTKHRFSA